MRAERALIQLVPDPETKIWAAILVLGTYASRGTFVDGEHYGFGKRCDNHGLREPSDEVSRLRERNAPYLG